MRVYGYRIHTLQPQLKRTKKFLKLEDVDEASTGSEALEAFCNQIASIEGKLQIGTPTYLQDAIAEEDRLDRLSKSDNAPHFLLASTRVDERKVFCEIRIGRESDHDAVSSRSGTQEPMKQKAAVRSFQTGFIFPEKGDYAFMVSEVIGGSYAGIQLMHWLTRTAQRNASTLDKDGNRSESPWLNWNIDPRVDSGRIDDIMSGTSNHRIELTREGINGIGTPHGEKITLTRWGFGTTPAKDVSNAIRKLASRKNNGTRKARKKQAADDLIELIDDRLKTYGFTDGQLVFLENGKTQRIHSEVVEELYVYPTGNTQEDIETVLQTAKPAVKNIAASIKQELLDY